MKNLLVLWTVGAEANLLDAIEFVAADNPNAAHRIAAEIRSKAELLTWSPGIGKSGRVPDTRELVVGGTPYVVIYRVVQNAVEILRILHTAQRWPVTRVT